MRRNVWIGILGTALILSLAWGFTEYRQAEQLEKVSTNQYQRSLRDFASHLDQLETDLAKGRVAAASSQRVLYLSQAGSISESAVKDLAQLPAEESGLSYISEFLNRTGDLTRSLAYQISVGHTPTAEDDKNLTDVHERLLAVNQKVQDLVQRVDTEGLAWLDNQSLWNRMVGFWQTGTAEAAAESADGPASSVRSGLDQLNASLQKLPPFSYVGEYESRSVKEPLGLPRDEVDKETALKAAKDFLSKVGYPESNPEFSGVSQGALGVYIFKQNDLFMTVSKRGGKVLIYRDQREFNERTMSAEQAREKVAQTLKALEWNLVLTSTEDFGGYLQLEYVWEESGTRYYPDKLRITVALDNGQIIGYDSTPYYAYHQKRNFTKKLTMEQARAKLRQGFQIKETRTAVIPVMGNKEVMAYEFRGVYKDEEYLVYINAETGIEERIQRIIKTPRGEYLQ
ncbi:PepSY1/2 domain-containing protein [Desulfitobacterium chlororespirans]|uniref:Spore germination protein n=1 Tax=Desulfitobacterium chlororespirans DSM 11544 TaxID=1121395 RepID=A0A1M7TDQ6_9FIRM|nr:PepSY1/2 domain-containing protein [Desulfitobacterium chlororespirans]SHN68807.1 spore germination protein [Desulfitobacterium chlororespirans DSM 11544]